MLFRLPISMKSLRFRRLVTAAALVSYAVSIWGLPLPTANQAADDGTPFICQGHACGCSSAEQCWRDCCCYTPAERLAWATAHNVKLPAEVQSALVAAAHRPAACDDDHDCCASHDEDAHECCATPVAKASASDSCGHCAQPGHVVSSKPGFRWVLGIEARKCRGLSTLWVTSGACLPLEILSLWEFDWRPQGQVEPPLVALASVTFSPAVPPPRA